jgi:hypothetical protein
VKVRRGKRKTTAKIKDDDENDDENGEATKIERVLISVKPKIEHAVCVLGMCVPTLGECHGRPK